MPEEIKTLKQANLSNRLEKSETSNIVDMFAKQAFEDLPFTGKICLTPWSAENDNSMLGGKYSSSEIARAFGLFTLELKNPKPETILRWQQNSIIPNDNGTYSSWTNLPQDGQWSTNNIVLLNHIKQGINVVVNERLSLPDGLMVQRQITGYADLVASTKSSFENPQKHKLVIEFDNGFAIADTSDTNAKESFQKNVEARKNELLIELVLKRNDLKDIIHRYTEAQKPQIIEALIQLQADLKAKGSNYEIESKSSSLINLSNSNDSSTLQTPEQIRFFLERNLFNPSKDFKGLTVRNKDNQQQENRQQLAQESLDRIAGYRTNLVNTTLSAMQIGSEFSISNFVINRLKTITSQDKLQELIVAITQAAGEIKRNNPTIEIFGSNKINQRSRLHTSLEISTFLRDIAFNNKAGGTIIFKNLAQPKQPIPTPFPTTTTAPNLPQPRDFEQSKFVTINEFSTGLNLDTTSTFSMGFASEYMFKTENSIPDEIIQASRIVVDIGTIRGDSMAMIIQETKGYNLVITSSNFKDESRPLNADRFFYTSKTTPDSVENLIVNATKFDPLDKNPSSDKSKISNQELLHNQEIIAQNERYITEAVNAFKPANPVLINPTNPRVSNIVILEIAKRISQKLNLPLSAAINIPALQNPNSFLVIAPINSSAASMIADQIKNQYGERPDTYEAFKIDDTVKYFYKGVPSKNESPENFSQRKTFADYMQNFNTKIWPDIQNNPANLANLMVEFEKYALSENSQEKKFNFEQQNLIMLAAIFDPSNYLNKVKAIITSPLTETTETMFGQKVVTDKVKSNDMKNRGMIYLRSLLLSFTNQDLKNLTQDLINTLEKVSF